MKRLDSGIQLHGLVSKVCRFFQCCLAPGIGTVTHQQRSRCSLRVDTAFVECVPYFHSRRCTGNLHLETVFRAHHAAERKFDEPIGSAGNRPQGGLCKPPARPVVMIYRSAAALRPAETSRRIRCISGHFRSISAASLSCVRQRSRFCPGRSILK